MDVKSRGVPLIMFFLFVLLSAILPPPFSAANQLLQTKKPGPIIPTHSLVSSTVFPIRGNVYPQGYVDVIMSCDLRGYSVSLNIGNHSNIFHLQIDTGNDLTWVQCDLECNGCTLPKKNLYNPHANFVNCSDPLCGTQTCSSGSCLFESYSGGISTMGVMVRDPIYPTTSPQLLPAVAFGCVFDQEYSGTSPPPSTGGVLGLGNGNMSILSQLHSLGLVRNVMGHCISSQGGGFLFFGDEFISSRSPGRTIWTPMVQSQGIYYNTGPADLLFNGKPTSVNGLQLNFDCGTTYTYFNSQAYQAVVDLVNNDLQGKPLSRATEDQSLPICWKGVKPFKSLHHVRSYFKPLILSFTESPDSQLQLPPATYLIISDHGNVCLGILDGTEMGFANVNIIGDISLQDKLVIYDNEKQQIGWAPANCDGPN